MLKGLPNWLILLVNTVQDFSRIYVCVCIQFSQASYQLRCMESHFNDSNSTDSCRTSAVCPWSILESPQEYHKCSHMRPLAPGIPMPVLLLGSILDVCYDSTERGVISGEAREQCISPLYRSPLFKVFPKSAASVFLSYRLFSDTVLRVCFFFFLMGSIEDAQKLKSFFLSSNSSE